MNTQGINAGLVDNALARAGLGAKLIFLEQTDSTNRALWHLLEQTRTEPANLIPGQFSRVLLADHQTDGYGRHGQKWYSPSGVNLYASVHFLLPKDLLSTAVVIAVSVSVRQILARLGQPHAGSSTATPLLKWPNDIMFGQKKVCGILLETRQRGQGMLDAVLGVGVNVNMATKDTPEIAINQPWTSLAQVYGRDFDLSKLVAALVPAWQLAVTELIDKGLAPALGQWSQFDALASKTIEVIDVDGQQQNLKGQYVGIDALGRLRLRTGDGIVSLSGGHISPSSSPDGQMEYGRQ